MSRDNSSYLDQLPFSTKKRNPGLDGSLGAAALVTDKIQIDGEDDPFSGELFPIKLARHQLDKVFLVHLDQELKVIYARLADIDAI